MRSTEYLWVAVGQIASTLAIQVIPMVALPVRDYAVYAVVYLAFAALLALQYATVCDVWARMLRRSEVPGEHLHSFQAALTALALGGGTVVGLLVLAISGHALLGLTGGAATTLAMYRSGLTYRLVASGRIRRAGVSELLGAAVAGSAAAAFLATGGFTTSAALMSWSLGALCAALAAGIGVVVSPRAAAAWFRDHRRDIGLLSAEAAIKTLETVGTPFLVGAVSGALPLALHRAASSLTYPVRLAVEVLRSRIISGAIGGGVRQVLAIGAIGLLAGAAVATGLRLLTAWTPMVDGTIVEALSPHAVAVGAWLSTMAVSSFLQFVGRGSLSGRRLLGRRIANTAVVLGVTASGVLVLGPGAVIWSAAVAEALAALLWVTRSGADATAAPVTATPSRLTTPAR
ncbi:hypothetical protein [Brachybacterium sp. YJGR34]|uniref:hypothetical protein n=1 Tax=Brachybacterium sp. YJGR34 TaxID=2059911 RepID=UPI000E0C55F9|nr:hypothetical protein [Brachybacterium sp. YJGR34]